MNKQFTNLALALITAVIFSTNLQAADNKTISDNVVKIGVLSDMSGVFSDLSGEGSVAAAKLAISDFKSKFKPSFEIELITGDHQNKTSVAVNVARDWYDNKKVDMITDVINSAVAIATSKIATEKNKLLIVTGSGSTKINNEDCSRNTILYAWNTYSFAALPAAYLTDKGHKKWYFIGVDYALGHSLQGDATKIIREHGGEVIGSVHYPLGTADFTSYVLQAQSAKADVISLAGAGAGLQNSLKTAKSFGLDKTAILTAMGGSFDDVVALTPKLAQGLLLAEGFYWDINDETRAWSKHFEDATGKKPSMLNAGLYSAINQYLQAVQRAKTDDALAVIKNIREQDVINDVVIKNGHLRDDNLMSHDVYLFQVKTPDQSRNKWDVYNTIEVADGNKAFGSIKQSTCALVEK